MTTFKLEARALYGEQSLSNKHCPFKQIFFLVIRNKLLIHEFDYVQKNK
jgi:hypothetical protein